MDERYTQLAERIGLGHSQRIAKIFSLIADPDEADLLLAMPGQAPELAAKLGRDPGEVEEAIELLFKKGLAFSSAKTDPPTWRMSRDLVQFHDGTLVWDGVSPEYLAAWREYMNEEWPVLAKTIAAAKDKPFTRVIPVGVSLPVSHHIMDFDSVADMIDKASKVAVTKCTCRLSMGNCDRPLDVCLQINRGAEYTIKRGSGRELTKEEALDVLREAEEAGLIHVTLNKSVVDGFICNCCPCCCQTMPVLIEHGTSVVDPSRFAAAIDAAACSGCGVCHDRCYFGALSWVDGEEGGASQVDQAKCMGCGLCLVTCPDEAITLEETRPKEFVPGAA